MLDDPASLNLGAVEVLASETSKVPRAFSFTLSSMLNRQGNIDSPEEPQFWFGARNNTSLQRIALRSVKLSSLASKTRRVPVRR